MLLVLFKVWEQNDRKKKRMTNKSAMFFKGSLFHLFMRKGFEKDGKVKNNPKKNDFVTLFCFKNNVILRE